ncbi:unnamed protein product [Echinostoma caproni]|uniref:Uncharacterized protein n=1 Tax=Echinostoma caproni TaxID=27848 RepID=A0A183ATE5_9TREM|nr:unnamed protein product [Echinostoma caproni]
MEPEGIRAPNTSPISWDHIYSATSPTNGTRGSPVLGMSDMGSLTPVDRIDLCATPPAPPPPAPIRRRQETPSQVQVASIVVLMVLMDLALSYETIASATRFYPIASRHEPNSDVQYDLLNSNPV